MAGIFGMSPEKVIWWDKALGWQEMARDKFDKTYIEDPPGSGSYRLRKVWERDEAKSDSQSAA